MLKVTLHSSNGPADDVRRAQRVKIEPGDFWPCTLVCTPTFLFQMIVTHCHRHSDKAPVVFGVCEECESESVCEWCVS